MDTVLTILALLGVVYLIYARVVLDGRPAIKRPVDAPTGGGAGTGDGPAKRPH